MFILAELYLGRFGARVLDQRKARPSQAAKHLPVTMGGPFADYGVEGAVRVGGTIAAAEAASKRGGSCSRGDSAIPPANHKKSTIGRQPWGGIGWLDKSQPNVMMAYLSTFVT
jgi:hypothetical protein